MFCGCSLTFGEEPNTTVCPVCMGYPGALPVLNREAVRLTVISGLMLGCEISRHSIFDRKNYFYPDMSKDYQITQNTYPLCLGGGVTIETPEGPKRIRIHHIHMEEDAAKINHYAGAGGFQPLHALDRDRVRIWPAGRGDGVSPCPQADLCMRE